MCISHCYSFPPPGKQFLPSIARLGNEACIYFMMTNHKTKISSFAKWGMRHAWASSIGQLLPFQEAPLLMICHPMEQVALDTGKKWNFCQIYAGCFRSSFCTFCGLDGDRRLGKIIEVLITHFLLMCGTSQISDSCRYNINHVPKHRAVVYLEIISCVCYLYI